MVDGYLAPLRIPRRDFGCIGLKKSFIQSTSYDSGMSRSIWGADCMDTRRKIQVTPLARDMSSILFEDTMVPNIE